MKEAFALLVVVHASIHLLGFAKAFGLAKLPALGAISRAAGLSWLAAGLAYLATAIALFWWPERWWLFAAGALVLSQSVIVSAWRVAKYGTLPNLVVLVPVVLALLDLRSTSLPSTFHREIERRQARLEAGPPAGGAVTETDLAPLPAPVQLYLRRVGVVGRPRPRELRARWHGQFRSAADAPWMQVRVEQASFFDEPTRIFFMRASRNGIPFQALHRYADGAASMRVRVLSLFDVVDAKGPRMTRSETVTFFNDMCLLAPASLLDPRVAWEAIDDRHVRGRFTHAGNTVSAELAFDAAGDLEDFVSSDRAQSADGEIFRELPWSTPVRDYRDFGGVRVASYGEAIWREPTGDFTYARFELERLDVDTRMGEFRDGKPRFSPTSTPVR